MTTPKLLGLLFEHLENSEVFAFHVYSDEIYISFNSDTEIHKEFIIDLNKPLLEQYNKIFGYN